MEADEAYHRAVAYNKEIGATRGIDAALKEHKLDAFVLPIYDGSMAPSGVYCGHAVWGRISLKPITAIAGYPIITGESYPQAFAVLPFLCVSQSH